MHFIWYVNKYLDSPSGGSRISQEGGNFNVGGVQTYFLAISSPKLHEI